MRSEREFPRRRVIWKFEIVPDAPVMMPMDAEIMCFQFQRSMPCIWAIVDPDIVKVPRRFEIFGTGQEIPGEDKCCYVGTEQVGPLVWHLFELI